MAEGQNPAVGVRVLAVGGRIELDLMVAEAPIATASMDNEAAFTLQDNLGAALLETVEDSRWKCPSCGSHDVQVSLPTWYRETSEGNLVMVNTDGEASVQYWHCEACDDGGSGEPERVAAAA